MPHQAARRLRRLPPRHVYEQIGIDHLGPFKTTERANQHLIVCIDYLARYLEVRAVPSTNTAAVVRFLKERIFTRHGVPSILSAVYYQ